MRRKCYSKKNKKKFSYWQKFWGKEGRDGWYIIYDEIKEMMGKSIEDKKIIRKIGKKYHIEGYVKDLIDYNWGYLRNLKKHQINFDKVYREFGWDLALKLFWDNMKVIANTAIIKEF